MTNTKSTKRALVSSIMALILCFAMLLGTTYAWFTDSVTSANNIITSGNLDVELYHSNSYISDEKVGGLTDLFTVEEGKTFLWEPGAVVWENFKVANEGTLALKYQLMLNFTNATETASGKTLADVLKVAVVTGGFNGTREDAKTLAYNYSLSTFALEGMLTAGAAPDVYGVVIYWEPSDIDNDYNVKGGLSINLGVNLFATQAMAEEDSFGSDYDQGAPIVMAPIARPDGAVNLKGAEDVVIYLSEELVDALPAGVTEIAMSVSEPVVDTTAKTITFAEIELVDQNGDEIDLAALNKTIKVTLPAQNVFAVGETVILYHDGEYVATAVVNADTTISYEVAHLCEVTVSKVELPVVKDDVVEIGTAAQLIGFAQDVNAGNTYEGKTVVLTADIDLNNVAWTPIGNFTYDITTNGDGYVYGDTFKGTFDGKGYTIKNLYVNAPETSGVGLFGYVTDATVQNLTIENVNLNALSHVAAFVARAKGTLNVSNCHVTGDVRLNAYWAYLGGIVGKAYKLNIDECSVVLAKTGTITSENRNAVGSIVAWMEYASNVTNCDAKNLNLTGWANIGSITGFVVAGTTVDSCTAENIVLTKTRQDGHPTIGLVAGGWNGKNITLKNNSVNNITLNGNYVAVASANILYGAEFYGSLDNSGFILENNVADNVTNNLVEVTKITDGIVQRVSDNTYMIYNANGLKSLSGTKIKGSYELVADIDLEGAEFKAMSAWYASATFNGNGYTISNANVVSGDNDNGTEQASIFFVSTNGALTVSDLVLKDITVTTKNIDNGYAAAVVGYCEGALVLNNVDVVNATLTGSKSSGMLVGHLTPAGSLTATDCDVNGSITISSFEANGHYAGKYVGTVAGNTALTNCTASVTLGGNLKDTNAGDICGRKVSGVLTFDGATAVFTADELKAALAEGKDVIFANDITMAATESNGYGKTGINVKNGQTIDGNGFTLKVTGAGSKWDSAISTTGGIIKNLTVAQGFRGIFINHNSSYSETVVLDNVTIHGPTYSINCDQGMNQNLVATNCTIDGWTSFAATVGTAKFVNCEFGYAAGYKYARPYAETEFVNCTFCEGYYIDTSLATVTFTDCTGLN